MTSENPLEAVSSDTDQQDGFFNQDSSGKEETTAKTPSYLGGQSLLESDAKISSKAASATDQDGRSISKPSSGLKKSWAKPASIEHLSEIMLALDKKLGIVGQKAGTTKLGVRFKESGSEAEEETK